MSTCQRCGRRKNASDPIWCAQCRRWFRRFVNAPSEDLTVRHRGSRLHFCRQDGEPAIGPSRRQP